MKHCILTKFKKDFDFKGELDNIKAIFDALDFDGFKGVEYVLNCVDRENRYDLLIRIDMDKDALEVYDSSETHHRWKEKYSEFIDKKAIFDYE